jgi:hypothetical protein
MKNLVPEDKPSWSARLSELFTGPPKTTAPTAPAAKGSAKTSRKPEPDPDPGEVLPREERKAAMSGLDATEQKLSLGALVLASIGGIAIPAYILASNKVTKAGKNSIAVAPDAALLGGAILLFCLIGFLALWKRKRTLVTFDLLLIGFGFTIFIGLVGFVFIFLGGWLMLRAWRINRYGTTSSKVIAREAAARPRGRDRKQATNGTTTKGKAAPQSAGRKPPTASKRYTPKSPPRRKIPKPATNQGE